jgi:hypothetical protein
MFRVNPRGYVMAGCSNTDGSATEFHFDVLQASETLPGNERRFMDPFHVRINVPLQVGLTPKTWRIGNPDHNGGALAWTCRSTAQPCDITNGGTVSITRSDATTVAGSWDLTFPGGRQLVGPFEAVVRSEHRVRCPG